MIIQYQKLLPMILINYLLNFLIVSTVFFLFNYLFYHYKVKLNKEYLVKELNFDVLYHVSLMNIFMVLSIYVIPSLTNRVLYNLLLVFVIAHLIEDWHKEILKLH